MNADRADRIAAALDTFRIELPSWGFANTGTRFGKFLQAAAATTLEEKFADAAQVHRAHRVLPDAGAARAVGPARRRRDARRRSRRSSAAATASRRLDQPEPVPGSALQVRLVRQPRRGCARRGTARTCDRERRRSAGSLGSARRLAVVRRRLQLPRHGRTSASGKHWFDEALGMRARTARARSAHAGRVQAVRAGLLPHRHRRLGHGAAARARRRPAGARARRHRASLPGAEHRADRRLAARRRACSAASTSTTAATPTTT